MTSQEVKDTIQAIKDGDKELKEGKTITLSSLFALIKIDNREIYR